MDTLTEGQSETLGVRYTDGKLPLHRRHPATVMTVIGGLISTALPESVARRLYRMNEELYRYRMGHSDYICPSVLAGYFEDYELEHASKTTKSAVELLPVEAVMSLHGNNAKDFLEHVSHVYAFGAEKYAERNWEKGLRWDEGVASSFGRHLLSMACGEHFDDESQLTHLSHLAFGSFATIAFWCRGIGVDDRGTWTTELTSHQVATRLLGGA